MRFTSFDFETCNGSGLSAVDLGIAIYERHECWRLVETRSWRFSPIDDEFLPRCSQINGIFKPHVDGLPGFADRWPEIEPYFRDTMLVAHSASFDVRILCSHLDYLQIERPNTQAHCTQALVSKYLRCDSCRLPDVCKHLRIPLQHHNSVSDAVAAGRIYSHLFDRHATNWSPYSLRVRDWSPSNRSFEDDFDEYLDVVGSVEYRSVEVSDSQVCNEEWQSDEIDDELQEAADLCFEIMENCTQPILEGWAFSITGDLRIDREPLVAMVRKLGAKCSDKGAFYKTVSHGCGPTNALIISEEELQAILNGKRATKKMKDAIAARDAGRSMVIVPEIHFYELVCNQEPIPRDGFQECDIADAVWSLDSIH